MSVSREVDVAAVTGRAGLSALTLVVTAMCGLMAVCDGLDNQTLAFTAPAMAAEWHLTMPAFVPVFTIGLFGLMVGSFAGGWVGDRFGRKPVLVLAGVLFGATTLLTPFAPAVGGLMALRFIGGLGIGALPAAISALIAEHAPASWRATLTLWAETGIPLGGFLGGFAAAWMIPHFGWTSVYYAAAVLTGAIVVLTLALVPESTHFLALKGAPSGQIAPTLNALTRSRRFAATNAFVLPASEIRVTALAELFRHGRTRMTLLFWIAEIVELMIFYVLVNWTPTLLREGGASMQVAVLGTVALNSGAILITLALGPVCRRFGDRRVTAATYLLTALGLGLTVLGGRDMTIVMVGIFLAGAGCIGGQAAVVMTIAGRYPTAIRALGVGWSLTVGRIGSIISPSLVGIPLANGWTAPQILLLPIVPALIGGVCVLLARPPAETLPLIAAAADPVT